MNAEMKNNDQSNLSRDDIRSYQSTSDERLKHTIEKKSLEDDFDSDALEGWTSPGASGLSMKKLDQRFGKKFSYLTLSIGAISLMVVIVSILFIKKETENLDPTTKTPQVGAISYEKTDIVLPESIEEMKELPIKEQIQIKTIQKDFEEQKQLAVDKNDASPAQEITALPVKEIEETKAPDRTLRETLFGKEIYLNDLKVLDYRAYRSKPSIQTKQLELTGTPANQGEPSQENTEEFTWKNVDVPYIDYLEKSMEIFSRGNTKKALARFEEILKTYPDDLNALFYAGLCYYNLREFDKALVSFEKCGDSKYVNFSEEAEWYSAKSLLASGNKTEAQRLLVKIQNANGYYSAQAKKLLSTL
jgi:TolA-binding protein